MNISSYHIVRLSLLLSVIAVKGLSLDSVLIVVEGRVVDSSGVGLPYATFRIENTSAGTVCDINGRFRFGLQLGAHTFSVSYVGYVTKRIDIVLSRDTSLTIQLQPGEIQLPAVEVSGEDPAYPIVRRAIEYKKVMRERLTSYAVEAYAKETFGTDTALNLISESYSQVFNIRQTIKELIHRRRQSANLPEDFQLAKAGSFVNLYNDSVSIFGHTFISPIADLAFSAYEFRLVRSFKNKHRVLHEIEVAPLSATRPLFKGTLTIDDSSAGLLHADVASNEVFSLPFFDIRKMNITEHFSLYEGEYWLPIEYHVTAETKFRYLFISFQKSLMYKKSVVFFEYRTNIPYGDTPLQPQNTLLMPTAVLYDTTSWPHTGILPLSDLEKESYGAIAARNRQQNLPSRITSYYNSNKSLFQLVHARYNRSEGLSAGVRPRFMITSSFTGDVDIGYGLSDNRWKHRLSSSFTFTDDISVTLEFYDVTKQFPDNYSASELFNSLTALFARTDYFNYYLAQGYSIRIESAISSDAKVFVSYIDEHHLDAAVNTRFSLDSFNPRSKAFRINPSINRGVLRSIVLGVNRSNAEKTGLFSNNTDTYAINAEYSSRNIGSDFSFISLMTTAAFTVETMGSLLLYNPYLLIDIQCGLTSGSVPIQQSFSLESPIAGIAHTSVFRTVRIDEYRGDNFFAIALEHNFRNTPFVYTGLPPIPADIIVRFSFGRIRSKSSLLTAYAHPTGGLLLEYSAGIGRIAELLRIEFSVSNKSRFAVTAGLSL